ncbi:MAG: hypothetical protein EOS46_27885 [Mesorhizobium sp.]|uniref:hypothetical protein n=1 Tax=Mesorhizobium sp. TaxID=1871066 RepID=UPI000FEA5235|nr:hypothetical protein [Mesorhizobium sp.]RWF41617.1 MAG: hypothetical protein EOS46_27885 [Mesorhizobium sp.]
MNATAQVDLATVTAFDARLGDAWRINCQEVAESIRFCRQYMKTIAEADEMLTPTVRLHRTDTVEQAKRLLPWRLSLYLEHVKGVSLAEARMDAIGMPYALSSDDWRA